jgi:hypothetical protein
MKRQFRAWVLTAVAFFACFIPVWADGFSVGTIGVSICTAILVAYVFSKGVLHDILLAMERLEDFIYRLLR